MLTIWRATIHYQPILLFHVVLNYISKYAAKVETNSKIYLQILLRLAQISSFDAPTITVVCKLLTKIIVDRDIGA